MHFSCASGPAGLAASGGGERLQLGYRRTELGLDRRPASVLSCWRKASLSCPLLWALASFLFPSGAAPAVAMTSSLYPSGRGYHSKTVTTPQIRLVTSLNSWPVVCYAVRSDMFFIKKKRICEWSVVNFRDPVRLQT